MAVREKPALILLDMQLPKLSGFEVTRRLRQMPDFKHVPIIAVTAYAMKGDREKLIAAGCDAYLSKPIDTRELPGMIVRMLLNTKARQRVWVSKYPAICPSLNLLRLVDLAWIMRLINSKLIICILIILVMGSGSYIT